jgi:hypothetical protein
VLKGDLHRNRALANLKLQQLRGGVHDAMASLPLTTVEGSQATALRVKALYRAALAHYHLHDYDGVKSLMPTLYKIAPDDEDTAKLLDRSIHRVHE